MSSKSDQPEEQSHWWKPNDKKASKQPSTDDQSSPSESKDGGWDKRKVAHNVGVALDVLKQVSELNSMLAPLGTVCDVLKVVVDKAETVLKNDDDRKGLVKDLRQQLDFIQDKTGPLVDTRFQPSRSAVQGLVKSLEMYTLKLGDLQEVLEKMERKKEHGIKKLFHKVVSAEKDKGEIESCTSDLDKAFRLFMDSVTFFIADQTAELLARQALNQLQYVDGAQGNQHMKCLEGTRKLLLDEITQWASQRDAKPAFALIDQAGTGKSTISASMALKWEEEYSLLCRFFFSKPKAITSGENVASTLAMDIARSIPSVRGSIIKALEDNPTISGYPIEKKLELLVFTPLKEWREESKGALNEVRAENEKKAYTEVADLEKWHEYTQEKKAIDGLKKAYLDAKKMEKAGREDQYMKEVENTSTAYLKALEAALDKSPVIILDALDECSKDDRAKILQAFLQSIATFPDGTAPFKVYFTCRPEEDVLKLLKDSLHIQRPNFSLHSDDVPSNQQDIELYAKSRLKDILDAQEISQFVAKASGLFIWASTASTFIIDARDPTTIFNDLITSTLEEHPLDVLYGTILDDACQRVGKNELKRLLGVLQLVSTARRPLTVNEMDDILGVATKRGSSVSGAFVAALSSVLSDGSYGTPVRALHPTFVEYLLRNQDSPRFASLNTDPYLYITERCLAILLSPQLRHDICGVVEPGEVTPRNNAIEDMEQKIQANVPPGLLYAARYGMLHTTDCLKHEDILKQLRLFFEQKTLLWMELMSYLGEVLVVTQSISLLRSRLKNVANGVNDSVAKEDGEWCDEILRMIQPFESVIVESAQQVYYSALTYAPHEGKIFRHYYDSFRGVIPKILHGSLPLRPESIELSGHQGILSCLAFSPDGRRIASASGQGTWSTGYEVRLWDAETGAAIGTPLEGHTDSVTSISFSPDSVRLVSGSNDKTLRLWDVESAAAIGEPLSGHTDAITCVSFSPDDRKSRIISGSKDGTLRLWDGETGSSIGGPLSSHTAGVLCLSFSPDGRRIASGSEDCTLRLWDGATGEVIGEHLSGHTGPITCLSFFPDGHRLCSGSQDTTLRIWDAERGVSVGDPFSDHTAAVTCLSISRDGKIASGSQNAALRLWDGATGATISEAESSNVFGIDCLAFSPDGRRIAGSYNHSVLLYDAETHKPMVDYITNHVGSVTCLAFSPDGRTVASGDDSRILRLCDVETVISLNNSHIDHKRLINGLSFSPDGRRIASGSSDGTMILRDGKTAAAIGDALTKHSNNVLCLTFSRDSKKLATGGDEGSVIFWDAENRTALNEPLPERKGNLYSVRFSPDGRFLASLGQGSWEQGPIMQIWDVASGTERGEPLGGPEDAKITSIFFSPDSLKVVIVLDDYTFRLWDIEGDTVIGESFSGHTAKINGLLFSPDGSRIITASDDRTVRRWDVGTGEAIGEPLQGHDFWGLSLIELSQDGHVIAAATNFGDVFVWNAETGVPIGEPAKCDGIISSLEFRVENQALILVVDNSLVLSISTDPPNLQTVESYSKGLIQVRDPWTIVKSKAPIQFCFPSQFHLVQNDGATSCSYGGIIAYAADNGAVIIADCTHLL